MKKILFALLLGLAPTLALGAGSAVKLMDAETDPFDTASQQRGAKLYVSYCLACHEMKYQRWNRLAADLQLDEALVEQYLIFGEQQIHDTMTNAMLPDVAEGWFGVAPPDLSLSVRLRGADWVYTYLNSFYADESKMFGVNNLVFPDVGMPHVLAGLQGLPRPVYEDGGEALKVSGIRVPEQGGVMSPEEYREATRDLVNFMAYAAEPVKAQRIVLGVKVLIFLFIFLVIAYFLKKEYWKDVH
ncbi:cytochrome c1 [Alkalilimnicola sp. S0819]|uniref:cytochrome c1 n=1 Tax=Alkalilimnicola sp. S0819 TaxID=2613922 RepID=UPI0012616089|nr:cytochrome c1 [Alkalilimnicola sp. S0819]KAB7623840.1 cytochrome c1 [Alkalilimnicola sp. S0819]MPQ16716.1 cytochrome c1 [Alkalilimnicola sp. S0819]